MILRTTLPETAGDPVVRVVVHRERPEWGTVRDTVLPALQHFGIPYRTVDLSLQLLAAQELERAAAVLLAQHGLGEFLGAADAARLVDHAHRGLGVVNLDAALESYPAAWWSVLGLAPAEPRIPCVLLRVGDTTHPITGRRRLHEEIRVKTPVEVQGVEERGRATVLLDTGRAPEIGAWGERRPALIATTAGSGRIVQFLVSPRIWLAEHVGHGNGLSDLLWRSLVFCARRPFVLQAMPPFVTTRLDNVTGNRDHLGYLEVFNRHRYVAVAGLYVRGVREEDVPILRDRHERGLVECSAHSLDEDCRNLVYGRFDLQEASDEELLGRIDEVDRAFKGWGIAQAKVVNAHWGIVGKNAVPFLRARGQRFLMKPLRFDRAMYGDLHTVNSGWKPRPFGNYDLVMDAMPGFDDFYVASVQLPRNEGIDFLQGCSTCSSRDPTRDVEQAAQKGARMLRRGLENLFFGCLLTHEGRVYALTEGELDRILARIDELLEGWPRFHRGYDYIARYARSRDCSYISRIAVVDDRRLALEMTGDSELDQYLYVFDDLHAPLRNMYCRVPAFRGGARVSCDLALATATPGHPGPGMALTDRAGRDV